MQKKWNPESVIHLFENISSEEYRKLIEETAEILYSDFCQHPFDLSCASNELNPLEKVA